jgi:antitoxin component YwqK of YwqJK toxin-antitoxin module
MHTKIYLYWLIASLFLLVSCKVKKVEEKDINGNVLKKYSVLRKDLAQKHGVYQGFYDSGELLETAAYNHGALDGERIIYYKNGKKMIVEHYDLDKMQGIYESYYESGALKQKGIFENNRMEGVWQNFYETPEGRVKEEFTMKNGLVSGWCKEYASNGNIFVEGNKTEVDEGMDLYDGEVVMFDTISGKKIMIFQYDKGKLIKKDSVY